MGELIPEVLATAARRGEAQVQAPHGACQLSSHALIDFIQVGAQFLNQAGLLLNLMLLFAYLIT